MSRHQDSKAAAEANGRLKVPRSDLFNTTKALIAECDKLEFPTANFLSALVNARKALADEEFPW
jgi:hypothetical protein